MSDDKKRDRALQRRVRKRQAKTGESYQAAWRQLTNPDEGPGATLTSQDLGNSVPSAPTFTSRRVLSLHLPHIPPRRSTRVAVRANKGAIDVERIYISGAGTEGGANDWIVNDIEIEGRSQLALKDLSGALFGTRGVAANPRASTTFSIQGLDPVEHGHELALIVTYVGPNPEGVPFFASAVGSVPTQRPTVVPIATRTPLPPLTKTTIRARIQVHAFQLNRLEIQDAGTRGGAADWIVDDLRINGRTQFAQSGGIPGDAFGEGALDSFFLQLEDCAAEATIELDMIYIGLNEHGALFAARLEGTVLRDDYNVPPPDLHVVVETSGQGPGEVVIATCNWRAPATDNRTR